MRITVERPAGVLAGVHAEADPGPHGLVHAGEQWAPTSFFIGEHRHAAWELYLQAHGASRWRVGRDAVALGPGELLAVPPRTTHTMAGRPTARHHFLYAAVRMPAVAARWPAVAAPWATPRMQHLSAAGAAHAPFRQLVREVVQELPQRAVGLVLAVDTLVLEVTRLTETSAPQPVALVHPAVAAARRLLDEAPERRWSLASLAREVGLSGDHLAELFARQVGTTPRRYHLDRRIERAAELLAGTDLPVTAIALELGFSSSSHFARVFREVTGRTPRAYRADRSR